ncbi:unnamed protein product [Rotaria sp. Silwood1]|nr:unnamed protein product [Rotaria sp. Silwood1]CAF1166021.1 unnamed protein product [Rotaria sp. Silwood1]CAF3432650.1 unnamed protein product [Rotaria sp. Silwood1]CAF3490878.1 unnamed protein product [Rotaria sp. Silwood1]CAF4708681.1 unnamed protein product [Rotaria sp. Silwood1]
MSFISSSSHMRRVGIISSTTIAAIGIAFLFWKVYNRRTQIQRQNRTQNETAPLTKSASVDQWENAIDTPIRESLPTPQQLYKYGLEHLNISIDYWQRALTIINYSLSNSLTLTNQPDLIQHDETLNSNRLIELRQKIQFLLNKIDVNSNANELALILEQENEQQIKSTFESLPLTTTTNDYNNTILYNRADSIRVQQELQTVLNVQTDLNTFNDRRSLRSIRSTDSFESAEDNAEWLDTSDLIFDPSSPYYSLPPYYVYGLRLAEKNQVQYKKLRTKLLRCSSDTDYLAKLSCIRNACDEVLGSEEKKEYLKQVSKAICERFLEKAMRDKTRFIRAFEQMNALLADERNWSMITEELAAAGVKNPTVYNVGIDFMLLEGFEILDSPPSAMRTILQNRWFSETFREQALNKAVSCALKIRRATAKHQDGFLTTFLTLIEDMTPVFAWGILGPDSSVKPMCTFLKDTVLDFARSLYDIKQTDYSSLTALANDIDRQMNNLLYTIVQEMNVDPNILSNAQFMPSTVHFI